MKEWADLLLTSGLAAVVTALGTWAAARTKGDQDRLARRCELAVTFLSDETPTLIWTDEQGSA